MKTFIALTGLMLLTFASPTWAATLYLNDGSQVRGTIVSATALDLQVYTPDGTLNISTDRIARIDYQDVEQTPAPTLAAPAREAPAWRAQSSYYEPTPAQDPRQQMSFGFGVGVSNSEIDFSDTGGGKDDNDLGAALFNVRYLYGLTSHFSAGVDSEIFFPGQSDSQNLLPYSTTEVSRKNIALMGELKCSLVAEGPVRPYLLGGVGASRSFLQVTAHPNDGYEWSDTESVESRTLVDSQSWGLATTARLGIDFLYSPANVFTLEFGWTRMSNPSFPATPQGQDLGLSSVDGHQDVLGLTVRWGFRF